MRVLGASRFGGVRCQLLVKLGATASLLRVVARGFFQHLRGSGATALPERKQFFSKILDGVDFVIGHDDLARDWLGGNLTQIEHKRHNGLFITHGARHARIIRHGKRTVGDKLGEKSLARAEGRFRLIAHGGGIGVAPIDAMVISART